MKRFVLIAAMALVSAGMTGMAAHADTIDLTLSESSQATAGGTTLTYVATVSAPTTNLGTEFLNEDTYTFAGPYTLDDSPFLNNFPLSLDSGDSFTGELFDVVIPQGGEIGSFDGSFQILGGPTDADFNTLASVNFNATVTPEPSSLLLLGTGMVGLVELARRRVHGGRVARAGWGER